MQIEQLKACDEIASSRTSNWQAFCLEERSKWHHKELKMLVPQSFRLSLFLSPLHSSYHPSIFLLSSLVFLTIPFLLLSPLSCFDFLPCPLLLLSPFFFIFSFSHHSILSLFSLLTPPCSHPPLPLPGQLLPGRGSSSSDPSADSHCALRSAT